MATTRRRFLEGGAALLGGALLTREAALANALRTREGAPRTLVLLQLSGGNDGLSTLVPHGDDAYHRAREETRIAAGEVLALDDYRGLHPALGRLREVYDQGRLAIVQGVGYPKAPRSHFKSLEVWHTARAAGRSSGPGWVGRLCSSAWAEVDAPELVVHVGKNVPYSLHSQAHPPIAFDVPESYRRLGAAEAEELSSCEEREASGMSGRDELLERLRGVMDDAGSSSQRVRDAVARYEPSVEYPDEELGRSLKAVAALIDARVGARVLSTELGGFDTHDTQRDRHDARMRLLDRALGAFLADLRGREAGENALVLVFSEFGRRVAENGSGGTDHGRAGVLFAAGAKVKGGLYGAYPSLAELEDGDLAHTTDFRSAYGTVVERWFGRPQEEVLGERFPPLDFA